MKVDFTAKGLNISLDKVPRFIYINEEGIGVGQVYFDGVRRKGLQKVEIEALTRTLNDKEFVPLKYRVQYIDSGRGQDPQTIGNMNSKLYVNVNILDIDKFKGILDILKAIVIDERISPEIRQGYLDMLSVYTNKLNEEEK